MKKIFIGLLVVAAGAGVYFFFFNKKPIDKLPFQKEQLIGKWKLDSISLRQSDSITGQAIGLGSLLDSNFYSYHYEFRDNGHILRSLNDSTIADTSYFVWKAGDLLVKEGSDNAFTDSLTITSLDAEQLILLSKDSASFVFVKLK